MSSQVGALLFFFFLVGCDAGDAGGDDGGTGGASLGGSVSVGSGKSSASAGSGTTNGAGGAEACVGPAGNGYASEACDATNVGRFQTCPDDSVPPALELCRTTHDIFTPGAWETLLACLGELPATMPIACEEPEASENVETCLTEVYREVCPNPAVDALCEGIAARCAGDTKGFALDSCKTDLVPFNEAALDAYAACIEQSTRQIACASLHSSCSPPLF